MSTSQTDADRAITLKQLVATQHDWARNTGKAITASGHVPDLNDNLYQPISAHARQAFEHGDGGELVEVAGSPAKMRSVRSSSALAVNVFDSWTVRDAAPLLRAMGLPDGPVTIDFEVKFPTPLRRGKSPNLDVVIRPRPGGTSCGVAIESKLGEWLNPHDADQSPFASSYFKPDADWWATLGLPRCQALAARMQAQDVRFTRLDAAQLLKHALGLAIARADRADGCSLWYIFLDITSDASRRHRQELTDFADAVDPVVGFRWMTYQDLIAALRQQCSPGDHYVKYLMARYGAIPAQ